jgi:hypothetical protein
MISVFRIPDVFLHFRLCRDHFAAVDDRSAAYREDKIYFVFSDQCGAFLHFGVGWVCHDAGKFRDAFVILREQLSDCVVDAIAFDGSSAIGEQHICTDVR